jgi:tetratricopeptide (TPR) repeat protein
MNHPDIVGHPENGDHKNDELIHQALRLFIAKTLRENADQRSWIKQPNNFISAVAIVLSLLGIAYQIYRDRSDSISQDLASVSQIASDLTQLDYQEATAVNPTAQYETLVNNRRVVLLAEAGRLINGLNDRVPATQLAVLATEYADIQDFSTALNDLKPLTQASTPPVERLEAWRSIATIYSEEGPDEFAGARNAFAEAANVFPDPKEFSQVGLELTLYEQWANFESETQNYPAAFQHFDYARLLLNKFPCVPGRNLAAPNLETEDQEAIEQLRQTDPVKADSAQSAWNQVTSADKCPKSVAETPTPGTTGRAPGLIAQAKPANLRPTSTLCRFDSGPRAGTTFDFKQLGFPGIALGAACTDGQGSVGVTIK